MRTKTNQTRGAGRRQRGGMTLIEVMVAAVISLMVMSLSMAMVRAAGLAWCRSELEQSATNTLAAAAGRMTPELSGALRVETGASDAGTVTIVLPKTEGAGYALPLQDGEKVSFYLSDASGTPGNPGTILWRATRSGGPDRAWSLRGGGTRGAVDLGTAGLRFEYQPDLADPRSVRIVLTTAKSEGAGSVTRTSSVEVFLRNHRQGE